ncbi:MAG: 50S ribosomal protein L13 [Candidatus Polarisedimenticolia bacterium]|nr:50S ribosomal protein L13 [bacterium]
MRTYVPSPDEIPHGWWVADAAGIPLGRLASVVAAILRGKNKPQFTPFLDAGDFVVVVNADKVVLTGRKLDQKIYRRHSGYPGGLKEIPARTMLAERPERAVELAIKGMLPKNRLGRKMFTKLKVYSGAEHPHQAQQPKTLAVAELAGAR